MKDNRSLKKEKNFTKNNLPFLKRLKSNRDFIRSDNYNESKFNTSKLISKQRNLGKVPYGIFGNAADNACGAVMLHNLDYIMGNKSNFRDIYLETHKHGTFLNIGLVGTNALFITKVLKKKYNVKFYLLINSKKNSRKDILKTALRENKAIGMLYRWGNITNMHYIAMFLDDAGNINTYNNNKIFDKGNLEYKIDSLFEFGKIKDIYAVWGINNKNIS